MSARQAEREALKFALAFEEECERKKEHDAQTTFKEVAEEWIELMKKTKELKISTLERMKGLRERTYKAFGDEQINKITYKMIQNFIVSLAEDNVNLRTGKGLSQKTQKHYIAFISDVMRYAKKCDLIDRNPCKEVSTVATEVKEKDIYTLDEAKTLLTTMHDKAPLKYCVAFYILAFSGVRRGELMGLEYKNIDFETGVVNIMQTSNYRSSATGIYSDSTKTASSARKIYLQPFIIDMIKQLKESQAIQKENCGDQWHEMDRLFIQWDGKPMNPNTPYTWLNRFCEKNGLKFKGIHAFRHFLASEAYALGIRDKEISSILGHSQVSTTLNIYTHLRDKTNKYALTEVAKALLSQEFVDQSGPICWPLARLRSKKISETAI